MGHRFTDQRETGGDTRLGIPGVFASPGTEPLDKSDPKQAEANMPHLLTDVGLDGCTFERRPDLDYHEKYEDGRYAFVIERDGLTCEIQMPGIPVELVRYMGTPDQSIWDFPRLYVEGSSWVWTYAISSTRRELEPEEN